MTALCLEAGTIVPDCRHPGCPTFEGVREAAALCDADPSGVVASTMLLTDDRALRLVAASSPALPVEHRLLAWVETTDPSVAYTVAAAFPWGNAALRHHHLPSEPVTIDLDTLEALDATGELYTDQRLLNVAVRPPTKPESQIGPDQILHQPLGEPLEPDAAAELLLTHANPTPHRVQFLEHTHFALWGSNFNFEFISKLGLPPLLQWFGTSRQRGLPTDAYRSPLMWLPDRSYVADDGERRTVPKDDLHQIALFIELVANRWWNPDTGVWRDALAFAGLDLNLASDRLRVNNWANGRPDPELDSFSIPLDDGIARRAADLAVEIAPSLADKHHWAYEVAMIGDEASGAILQRAYRASTTIKEAMRAKLEDAYDQSLDDVIDRVKYNKVEVSPEAMIYERWAQLAGEVRAILLRMKAARVAVLSVDESPLLLPSRVFKLRSAHLDDELRQLDEQFWRRAEFNIGFLGRNVAQEPLKDFREMLLEAVSARIDETIADIEGLSTRANDDSGVGDVDVGWGMKPVAMTPLPLPAPGSSSKSLSERVMAELTDNLTTL